MPPESDGAVWPLIVQRARLQPSQPCITSIAADGARTELSGTSLLNAVAKSAGALVDEGDLGPGSTLALLLPWHWQRVVWTLAAWTVGAVIDATSPPDDADLVVTDRLGAEGLACDPWVVSLHPLGLVDRDLPSTVIDATGLARMQPDALLVEPARGDGTALRLADGSEWSRRDAMAWLAQSMPDADVRVLIDRQPDALPSAWLVAPLVPLLGTGAVIMTDGAEASAVLEQEGPAHAWS